MHYWDIWHNFKPIEDFRKYHYRFCSEYGFESLPDIKTVMSFAEKEDLDLCGNVMQCHQKCTQGNEKLMYYLAQMVNYPYDFERLIYCSQLVQADCIRSSVEHMRRARGRCMGSAYWQVNDSIPVRVTIQHSRKQRNIAVSEFFFYSENKVCPLLVRYSDFAADILVLSCAILRKKTERSVHRLSHSRLCGLEHMSIDVQSSSRIAMS